MLDIRDRLAKKSSDLVKNYKKIRKSEFSDSFERMLYINPKDIVVTNYSRSKPVVAFNPGAIKRGSKIIIFPRLIFDYYSYVSSIGKFSLAIDEIYEKSKKRVYNCEIIMYPQYIWERLGTEDARASLLNGKIHLLYTGKGYDSEYKRRDVLGYAIYSGKKVEKKGFFTLKNYIPPSNKDAAFLSLEKNKASILFRPSFTFLDKKVEVGWYGIADLNEMNIKELEPIFPFDPNNEKKVGWSTNAVELEKDLYAVGWHAVMRRDHSYWNGIAFVSSEGELIGTTGYILGPRKDSIEESYGDTSWVIFGDGLIKNKDDLLWIGGICDTRIGIFRISLEKLKSKTYWIVKK